MEIRTYTVYQFNELTKDAKQKAKDSWYETEEYTSLQEDLMLEFKELDTAKIFGDINIRYSLSSCQGDGLSFSASIDIDSWLRKEGYLNIQREALNEFIYKFTATGNKGLYSYASQNQIEWEDHGNKVPASIEDEIESIRKDIAFYYMDICRKLEKFGYSIIEYRMDDKKFAEHCEANGYMFLENGRLDSCTK